LIKLREEMIQKKIDTQERRIVEEENMKNKENRRVIAKIKYKEWNERKAEEARHKKMVDRMEKQRIRMDEQENKRLRLERIRNMKKRNGYGG